MLVQLLCLLKRSGRLGRLAQPLVGSGQKRVGLAHVGSLGSSSFQFGNSRPRLACSKQRITQCQMSCSRTWIDLERPAEISDGKLRVVLIQVAGARPVGACIVSRSNLQGASVVSKRLSKLEIRPFQFTQTVKGLD